MKLKIWTAKDRVYLTIKTASTNFWDLTKPKKPDLQIFCVFKFICIYVTSCK